MAFISETLDFARKFYNVPVRGQDFSSVSSRSINTAQFSNSFNNTSSSCSSTESTESTSDTQCGTNESLTGERYVNTSTDL